MDDFTRKFDLASEKDAEIHEILSTVYRALEEKGYTFASAQIEMVPQTFVTLTEEGDLKNMQKLIDMLKDLKNYKHTVLYYGPMEVKDMAKVVDKYHALPKKFSADPESRPYKMELTPANEVVIAPYKAKNIYMYQYHNEGKKWTPEHEAMINMFNGYFGGGMNTVVFQELRESRGLAYSAWASYMTPFRPADSEFFLTSIISQNDKMNDCIATFNSIMNNVPQSEKAFEIAKQAEMKRIEARRTTKLNII